MNKKKIPCTPTLFDKNTFITDFKLKAKVFNRIYDNQRTSVENGSILLFEYKRKYLIHYLPSNSRKMAWRKL